MQVLISRFHLLILIVTIAITGVAFFRVPADYAYPAHWSGSTADWLWPRDVALPFAPILQIVLLVAFFVLGRAFTKNQFAKSQHILDPALTLLMLVVASCQLGLLLTGIGSDLDFIRLTGFGLGILLLVLGVVLFEAERNTYAGLRMPWPIPNDKAWKNVHRIAGLAYGFAGAALLTLAWLDLGIGSLILSFAAALFIPATFAALATLAARIPSAA
ncbi:SdpI family protein [Devosia submarina]|uniref:SdpI family protein n=1 Tax=Devosia submarina TaxID=1173082 RepID=UPI000D37062D|nr:SdpI family protein [Devosia submarina]